MTPPAEVHETHVGIVFLVGDRAYKVKKPVRTEFLDFSTPALRSAACRREVELNRRLAPDVYLGVSDLLPGSVDTGSVEHLVVMRRMPAERCLATLVARGTPVSGALRALARRLAAFHAAADRGDDVAADGTAAALRRRWVANLDELAPFAGTILDDALVPAIRVAALRFVDGRAALFSDRLAQSRIVDGHGDLVAADVFCLDDGPRALDCLEFDDHLRHVDGLDDVAFLAMDLEHLGRADLAEQFLDDYVEFSGDTAPIALRHHFIAYRAVVRAKVACLRHAQGDPAAAAAAVAYATLALRHLERGAVRLALVGGLPGTGKTTLGGALADRFGAVLISSDRVRKEMAGIDPDTPATAPFGEGLYSTERVDATYAELLDRAALLLGRGESVVLDPPGPPPSTAAPPRNSPTAPTATSSGCTAARPRRPRAGGSRRGVRPRRTPPRRSRWRWPRWPRTGPRRSPCPRTEPSRSPSSSPPRSGAPHPPPRHADDRPENDGTFDPDLHVAGRTC